MEKQQEIEEALTGKNCSEITLNIGEPLEPKYVLTGSLKLTILWIICEAQKSVWLPSFTSGIIARPVLVFESPGGLPVSGKVREIVL